MRLFRTPLERLTLIGYLEGISLLILTGIAVPLKYWGGNDEFVRAIGPFHGALFVWFIFSTLSLGIERRWKFRETTWKIVIACIIPFGTFYVNKYILQKMIEADQHIEK
ncbi:integral membrane protein [Chitinophaga sp. YR627]|uniref:DUF3817 domain-containing protein n=1 Tax=Chitinophaga sp. YR627 TaxID=1881041 RepID=UPI0008F10072|nr:DUF3817 domain-containing protein [Chitinophaga sp. YR627]SFN18386.1 integral membrane protein [Chitinophaga sp. YR627]